MASTAGSIDRKQHRPGYAASDETGSTSDLQISKEQKPVQRLMIQNKTVRYFIEGTKPIEEPVGEGWRAFSADDVMKSSCRVTIGIKLTVLVKS